MRDEVFKLIVQLVNCGSVRVPSENYPNLRVILTFFLINIKSKLRQE